MKRSYFILVFTVFFSLLIISCKNSTSAPIELNLESVLLIGAGGNGSETNPYLLTVVLDEVIETEIKTSPIEFESDFTFELLKNENGVLVPLTTDDDSLFIFTPNNNDSLLSIKGVKLGEQYLRIGQEDYYSYALVSVVEPDYDYSNSLKVLAIGNSFSQDATEFLWEIADNYGIQDVIIGNMYIGGMDLEGHWANAESNSPSYTYYLKTNEVWNTSENVSIKDAILSQDWDIITIQQVSGKSGREDTYDPYLNNLISYIQDIETQKTPRLAWHMTWAYQQNSTHNDFVHYNSDQLTMYNSIINTVKDVIEPNENISFTIPAGTAIQNIRSSYMGDKLTRDGYHLSVDRGRFTAGLTWFKTITEFDISNITYRPIGVSELDLEAIKESVNNTFQVPFEITASTFTEGETINLEDLNLISLTYKLGYWYPPNQNITSNAGNSKYFIANEVRLHRSQLPVGSVLKIQEGYKYRNNYYTNISGSAGDHARSGNISQEYITIDDSWWGDFNYVGFNISKQASNADISNEVDSVATKLSIYVTKDAADL
tara:strand:- start:10767 stop:12398 length:1632 start_codon:yes stop_codon:yes gene_type:complete